MAADAELAAKLNANPGYQSALRDAESESWDGPGIDGSAMIEAAGERRRGTETGPDWAARFAAGTGKERSNEEEHEHMSMPQVPEKAVPVLYLDLDGTVRQGKDDALGRFVNGPEDVVVFPEAVEMMRRWKAGGGRIIGVSNQGGVALGIVTYAKVAAAMRKTYVDTGCLFDKISMCCHHPDARHPEMARCWCRKPSPGLIIEAALEVAAHNGEYYPPYMGLMVGDRPEDEQCARLAGLDFQWAADWRAQAS